MRIVCRQTILMKYHTLFFSKIGKDVAKFVVCCSRDWHLKGLQILTKFGQDDAVFKVKLANLPCSIDLRPILHIWVPHIFFCQLVSTSGRTTTLWDNKLFWIAHSPHRKQNTERNQEKIILN